MTETSKEYRTIKLFIIGDTNVGKTNILYRFSHRKFLSDANPTVGMEYSFRQFVINNQIIKVQLWDTPGAERFESIRPRYYSDTHGALVVFDLTQSASFDHVQSWIRELRLFSTANTPVILVGNKSDLTTKRQITLEQANAMAVQLGMSYMETSALNSSGIEQVIVSLTNLVLNQDVNKTSKTLPQTMKPTQSTLFVEQLRTNTLKYNQTVVSAHEQSDTQQKQLRQDFNGVLERYKKVQGNFLLNQQQPVDIFESDHIQDLLRRIDEWQGATITACCQLADRSRAEIKRLFTEVKQNDYIKKQLDELNVELNKQKSLEILLQTNLDKWQKKLKELDKDISEYRSTSTDVLLEIDQINWENIIKISRAPNVLEKDTSTYPKDASSNSASAQRTLNRTAIPPKVMRKPSMGNKQPS